MQRQDVPRPRGLLNEGIVHFWRFPHVHIVRRDVRRMVGVQIPIEYSHRRRQHRRRHIRPSPPPFRETESIAARHDHGQYDNRRVVEVVMHQNRRRIADGQLRREQGVYTSNCSQERREREHFRVPPKAIECNQPAVETAKMNGQISVNIQVHLP